MKAVPRVTPSRLFVTLSVLLVAATPLAAAQILGSATSDGTLAACDSNDIEQTCAQYLAYSGDGADQYQDGGGGGGESVVATYSDVTGNAHLVARDGFLYCQWDAVNPYVGEFIPTDYANGCAIEGLTSGGTAECSAGRTAAGECQLIELNLVAREDITWSVSVYGFEFTVTRTETQTTESETAVTFEVEGGCKSGLSVNVGFVGGNLVPAGAGLSLGCDWRTGAGVTGTNKIIEEETITVYERHAIVLGFTDLFVSTVAKVTGISWSGKDWGCDGLDLVEYLVGEREIADYSVHMGTKGAPTGSLQVDLARSELVDVTDRGGFGTVVKTAHGFTATFGGEAGFSSRIAFDVDYEYPDVVIETNMPVALANLNGSQESLDAYLSAAAAGAYTVRLAGTTLPPEAIANWVGLITLDDLAHWGGSLPSAVAAEFLADTASAEGASFAAGSLDGGACGPLDLTPDPQAWSATGNVESLTGPSTGLATTRAFAVDVIMDATYTG